ncbi:dTDP-4-dehydrorhamnose reductase [Nitrococcus mobilis]|uniref:dTDP-4-dehydrorhamnose reductase n=1 Tax=Nitrococcus mobilis Nb-231 TaxID=314278 RepID=A4BUQ8_9GAMM|nr:dTDP-4-dehydrorhamnose reductase [Nitrococcus mobilis]EAR20512.1 dTDP-4-dehydrorhamnose reductase [Nitrococcus mobilis Nb-231]
MKVLVTGANGQLGRALVRLAPAGVELLAYGRDALDVTQPQSVPRVLAMEPAVIVNAAAYTAVDQAETERAAAYAVNVGGAEHMARAARELGCRLVHISTDFVFDGAQGRPYTPESKPNPLNVYGASKLAGEQAAQAIKPDALILRTAWLYGETGSNFVHSMLRLMRTRAELHVVDDQIGTPTAVAGLAQCVWRAIEGRLLSGIQHWTDAGVASWYDFAVAIRQTAMALGLLQRPAAVLPVPSSAYPTPASRPAFSVLDKTATWRALALTPGHWSAALADTLAAVAKAGGDS